MSDRRLGAAGNENNGKSKNMYLDNECPSPTEFSKLLLMIKTKIITLSGVTLKIHLKKYIRQLYFKQGYKWDVKQGSLQTLFKLENTDISSL